MGENIWSFLIGGHIIILQFWGWRSIMINFRTQDQLVFFWGLHPISSWTQAFLSWKTACTQIEDCNVPDHCRRLKHLQMISVTSYMYTRVIISVKPYNRKENLYRFIPKLHLRFQINVCCFTSSQFEIKYSVTWAWWPAMMVRVTVVLDSLRSRRASALLSPDPRRFGYPALEWLDWGTLLNQSSMKWTKNSTSVAGQINTQKANTAI